MTVTDAVTLLNTAGLGVMAYLLLTRVDSRLSALERATNRFVRVMALNMIQDSIASPAVKREARTLLREIDHEHAAESRFDDDQEPKD